MKSGLPRISAALCAGGAAAIARRARETIWLTPEPRYSWGLGGCDLPAYAEYCSRVRVVRDLTGLESAATDLATELVGR